MGHMTGGKNVPVEGALNCILFGLASGVTSLVPTKRLLNRVSHIVCHNNKAPQFT